MEIKKNAKVVEGFHTYDSDLYMRRVERVKDTIFQSYQKDEINYIKKNVKETTKKTFVDLGAGYGRIIPEISKIGKRIIAIELGNDMFVALKRNTENLSNVEVINGDFTHLSNLISKVDRPVFLLMQNTLGLWVNESEKEIITQIREVAKTNKGEVIISGFNGESLKDWGVNFYEKIEDLVGAPDFDRIDYEKGLFISKTGYMSKWRSVKEMQIVGEKLGGKIIEHYSNHNYQFLHISYE